MKKKRPKMGRPPLPLEQRKLPTVGFRPTPTVRQHLEDAAAESGRSMSQEIQSRLEHTLWGDEQDLAALGLHGFDPKFFLTWRCLGTAIATIERNTGKSWRDDWDTSQRVVAAFLVILETFGPKRPTENRLTEKGRLKAEIRAKENTLIGNTAASSAIKAQMPGIKVLVRLMAEAMESEKDVPEGKPEE